MKKSTNTLIKNRIIGIDGEINGSVVKYIKECFSKLVIAGSPDIAVIISSNGGSVKAGLDVYDLLRLYPGKKIGLVVGNARSMASIILQACDTRYATLHADIMIHHIRKEISLKTLTDENELKKLIKNLESDQAEIFAILSKRTGKSVAEVEKLSIEEKDMSVANAKAFGLIDDIWIKPINELLK